MQRALVIVLHILSLLAPLAWARTPVDAGPVDAAAFAGVDPSGTSDSTRGLQAAAEAAGRAHVPLHLCGRFKISAPIRFHSDDGERDAGSGLVGCSELGAVLALTDAHQDGLLIEAPPGTLYRSCIVRNLTIEAPLDRQTGGAGIHLDHTDRCEIEQNRLIGMFVGVRLGSTSLTHLAHNAFTLTATNGIAVLLDGSDVNSYVVQNYADNPPSHKSAVGLRLTDGVNGTYVAQNSFSHFDLGLEVAPTPGGKVQNLFFHQNAWDLCRRAGALFDASRAPIYRIFLMNEWYAAASAGPGLRFAGDAGTSNIQVLAPQVRDNWTNGVELAGRIGQMVLTAPVITANNARSSPQNSERTGTENAAGLAILSGAVVTDLQVQGGLIGPTAEEWKSQTFAITIEPGATLNRSSIIGVDVAANAKGSIVDRGTGAGNVIKDDPGYDPVGGGRVAVGASPFTYRAGPTPETLYLSGGRCSRLEQAGVAIFSACAAPTTVQLGPNEALVVTYQAAPTINHVVH